MQKSAKNKLKKQANFNQNKQPCKSSKKNTIHKKSSPNLRENRKVGNIALGFGV